MDKLVDTMAYAINDTMSDTIPDKLADTMSNPTLKNTRWISENVEYEFRPDCLRMRILNKKVTTKSYELHTRGDDWMLWLHIRIGFFFHRNTLKNLEEFFSTFFFSWNQSRMKIFDELWFHLLFLNTFLHFC